MFEGSPCNSTPALPVTPLSAACIHAIGDHNPLSSSGTTIAAIEPPSYHGQNTSIEITIVANERVPNNKSATATDTIERTFRLRLGLPPSFDPNQLKSLNVKLHAPAAAAAAAASTTTPPSAELIPDSVESSSLPSSVTSFSPGYRTIYNSPRTKEILEVKRCTTKAASSLALPDTVSSINAPNSLFVNPSNRNEKKQRRSMRNHQQQHQQQQEVPPRKSLRKRRSASSTRRSKRMRVNE